MRKKSRLFYFCVSLGVSVFLTFEVYFIIFCVTRCLSIRLERYEIIWNIFIRNLLVARQKRVQVVESLAVVVVVAVAAEEHKSKQVVVPVELVQCVE